MDGRIRRGRDAPPPQSQLWSDPTRHGLRAGATDHSHIVACGAVYGTAGVGAETLLAHRGWFIVGSCPVATGQEVCLAQPPGRVTAPSAALVTSAAYLANTPLS